MRQFITLCAISSVGILLSGEARAYEGVQQPDLLSPVAYDDSYIRPIAESSPSDAPEKHVPGHLLDMTSTESMAGDYATDASCGCESSCGCDDGGWGCCLSDDCCLGDAWTLKDNCAPCCDHNFGGWFAAGYYSDNAGLSAERGDLLDFWDQPDRLNLDQAWVYAEKVAEGDTSSADWGYRADLVYGVDAQKTQAFGNSGAPNARGWDNQWDNGFYGWALPQLYGEVAYGDWSVKAGHFFTPIGYEVIPAPNNFFYSHSLTMFNSEPFTHTGVLGTYGGYEGMTLYAGWTLGWDTGFDQYRGGSNWLGGVTFEITDDVSFTYMSTAGNFGFRSADQDGYSHSLVAVAKLSDKLDYVLQSDYVYTDGSFGIADVYGEDVGINQYLFYTFSDCWKAGARMEWWKSNVFGEHTSFYELTGGLNYKPHANVVIRPEVRYDWSPTDFIPDYNREIFGVDAIFTF